MTKKPADLAPLESRIGHTFADRTLLVEALTHVSRSREEPTNQRLEFLGDRVLGLAIAELVMRADPAASEGDLSRRLAELVRRETCAEIAREWNLGPHLRLGGGVTGSLRRNVSVLADACEAVIAAVFRDGGFGAAAGVVSRAYADRLATIEEVPANPKTCLQEWAAARGRPPPTYAIVDRSGPDHAPRFQVAARVEGLPDGLGEGGSRRVAEQAAAANVLKREGVWPAEAEHV